MTLQTAAAGIAQRLRDIPLFAGLPEEDRLVLASLVRHRRQRPGERIFMAGDPGDRLYLIESGTVKICLTSTDGREVTLALLGPGEFFGDLALLDGLPRSGDAVAVEACQFLLLGRDDFLRFVASRPGVALHLLEVLSRRLRNDNDLVQDAAFLDTAGRLARVILRLARSVGHPVAGGILISQHLTQSDLAGMIGSTRESVNKWLVFFERQGLIEREHGLIRVLKPDLLEQRVTP
jgi:CRP/FNR family transcriptional regulator/CRP/FNR family cyclic AMP-dependent transcriptional regulator